MSAHKKTHPYENEEMSLERLIFFSDAVFAIAITLLALDIRLPTGTEPENVLSAIYEQRFHLISFCISFLVVGMYWMVHHRIFRYIQRYDGRLMWLDLVYLLLIALLPFPSSLLGEFGESFGAVVFYAGMMTLVGLVAMAVHVYSSMNHRLINPDLPDIYSRVCLYRILISPAVFLLSIPLCFIGPGVAQLAWLLIPVGRVIVSRIYPDVP